MLMLRLWALLPAYLTHPLPTEDVLTTFPELARLMYLAAKDQKHPELSGTVCQVCLCLCLFLGLGLERHSLIHYVTHSLTCISALCCLSRSPSLSCARADPVALGPPA
jgi:hypothetical protein